ncbi:hypothetical protein F2P44_24160 [Massilia sp. CCM 8695]|jgi:hypothetical protein|uniref:Uncharacterized protein n=1 Tax=Massilia frigida TaxID=2609281 RepID=A0ABX0NA91_9BURK|nr:hypothetical protein [Massilia frigida]NHZ82351.1 hypothetical protein [Massilia frigida]
MSNVRLWAIGNASNIAASFSSTNGDTGALPANAITHTGGSDGDYIRMPDCSGSQYFADHHISISANDGSWSVSLWDNDQSSGEVCWSPTSNYADGYNFPASQNSPNCTILIEVDSNNNPTCYWAPF